MPLDDNKIKQIEDLIDLAYDHCSCDELITSLKNKPQKVIESKTSKKKYNKWQQAFVNSQIFQKKF
ncbi:MAG: hypothetical protein COB02_11170 [Candidatus Cloacimonadota bacterium]|nr:MAG: hypothetical protein COB02_11170 [Candidatus Cloacimonadota bacterium]